MLILWNNANLLTVFKLLCPNINKIILEDSVELQWVSVLPKISYVISTRTHKKHCDLIIDLLINYFNFFFKAKLGGEIIDRLLPKEHGGFLLIY